jgi:hypothetical protein
VSNNHYVVPSLWMLGRRSDMSVLNDAILSLLVLSFLGSCWSLFWLTHTHTLLHSLVPSSHFLFFTGPIFSRFSWLRRLPWKMVTGFFCLYPQGTEIPFGVELLLPVISI